MQKCRTAPHKHVDVPLASSPPIPARSKITRDLSAKNTLWTRHFSYTFWLVWLGWGLWELPYRVAQTLHNSYTSNEKGMHNYWTGMRNCVFTQLSHGFDSTSGQIKINTQYIMQSPTPQHAVMHWPLPNHGGWLGWNGLNAKMSYCTSQTRRRAPLLPPPPIPARSKITRDLPAKNKL